MYVDPIYKTAVSLWEATTANEPDAVWFGRLSQEEKSKFYRAASKALREVCPSTDRAMVKTALIMVKESEVPLIENCYPVTLPKGMPKEDGLAFVNRLIESSELCALVNGRKIGRDDITVQIVNGPCEGMRNGPIPIERLTGGVA